MPEQGTVAASGDLAPLSHLALGLLGEGQMWSPKSGWADANLVSKQSDRFYAYKSSPVFYGACRQRSVNLLKTNIATCNKCIEILLTHSKFHLNRSHYIILNRRQLELEPL